MSQPRGPSLTPRSPSELLTPTRPPKPPQGRQRPLRRQKGGNDDGEPRRSSSFLRFLSGLLTFALLVLVGIGGLAAYLRASFDAPGPLDHTAVAVVPKGDGIYEIAGRLERDGIVSDRRLLVAHHLAIRTFGGLSPDKYTIKAGEYEVKAHASVRQVLEAITEGKAILYKFVVPEGLTSHQIVERLKADQNLSGEVTAVPPEGTLLPDTYKFARGLSRQDLLDRMQAEQQKLIAQLWAKRQPELPVRTAEQALTLASIVEKETGRANERDRVAAVFVNRLRKGMRLQSDPTIIYGVVGGQGPLGRGITRSEIDTRTPYNTYQIDGLPPGPICNPGRAAIEATLNPARTQDLFFVADGSGGHAFTSNLRDHNAAVANWRRIERDKARQSGVPPPAAALEPDPAPEEAAPATPAAPAPPPPAKKGTLPAKSAPSAKATETPPAKKPRKAETPAAQAPAKQ